MAHYREGSEQEEEEFEEDKWDHSGNGDGSGSGAHGDGEDQSDQGTPHLDTSTESEHNMGRGVSCDLWLTRCIRENEKKKRKNARSTVLTKHGLFFHENSSISELLEAAFDTAGCKDTLPYKVVAKKLRTTAFIVTMTVLHTGFKDVAINVEKDLRDIISAMEEKGKSRVRLEVTEIAQASDDTQEPEAQEEDEGPSKRRKRQIPAEEVAMAEKIVEIHLANRCNDRTCRQRTCFTANELGTHVNVTPMLAKIWAAAWIADEKGTISAEMPPGPETEKVFWPLALDGQDKLDKPIDDIALLASRCLNSANKATTSPTVTINNDFAAFASLLQPLLPATAQAPQTPTPASSTLSAPIHITSPAKPAAMTFEAFCEAFKLPPEIFQSLEGIHIDGPHILPYLTNEDLDKYLPLGLRARLRFAQAEWRKGKASVDG